MSVHHNSQFSKLQFFLNFFIFCSLELFSPGMPVWDKFGLGLSYDLALCLFLSSTRKIALVSAQGGRTQSSFSPVLLCCSLVSFVCLFSEMILMLVFSSLTRHPSLSQLLGFKPLLPTHTVYSQCIPSHVS